MGGLTRGWQGLGTSKETLDREQTINRIHDVDVIVGGSS